MVKLSDFTAEETELLFSVVYRAGIYISYAEDEGGDNDDEREHHALETCIGEIARVYQGSDFIRDIALGVMDSKDRWPVWTDNVHSTEAASTKAVALLRGKAGLEETKKFIKMVTEVASSVAHAYGEFGLEQKPEKGLFGKLIKKFVGEISSRENEGHPMNVSAAEDDAISRLAQSLKKGL